MKFKIYTYANIRNGKLPPSYKQFVRSNPYSGIWHQVEWLDFQIGTNNYNDGFCFIIENDLKIIMTGLVLIKRLPFNLSYAYIPGGFLFNELSEESYNLFLKILKLELKKRKTIFCDIDFIRRNSDVITKTIKKAGNYKKNKSPSIPIYTNQINLSQDEEDILKQMKHKGRYNIKLSRKKGVVIREATTNDIESFYNLLLDTTKRDGFRGHSLNYYTQMLTIIPNCKLLIAEHEKDILAAGIFVYTGDQALYYYGASSNIKRNLMAPYLLQWEAIKIGKELNCNYYDFMGIADPNNKHDRLTGVTDFKLKFGGEILHFQDAIRIVINKSYYLLYNIAKLIKK